MCRCSRRICNAVQQDKPALIVFIRRLYQRAWQAKIGFMSDFILARVADNVFVNYVMVTGISSSINAKDHGAHG